MKQPNFPHFYMRLNEMQIKFKIFLALLLKMGGIAAIHQKFPRFWWKKVEPKGVAVYQRISTLYATRLAKLH